jgi:choline dehydrogenase
MPPVKHDYVIVGAGSAGCVLANRLSANGAASVALLEAGPEANVPEVKIPAAFRKLFKTERDWNYTSEPQADADRRSLYMPRGCMVGGCSSINAMLYLRGNRLDYDDWAELTDPSWSYRSVLPYFKKSERAEKAADMILPA